MQCSFLNVICFSVPMFYISVAKSLASWLHSTKMYLILKKSCCIVSSAFSNPARTKYRTHHSFSRLPKSTVLESIQASYDKYYVPGHSNTPGHLTVSSRPRNCSRSFLRNTTHADSRSICDCLWHAMFRTRQHILDCPNLHSQLRWPSKLVERYSW